MRFLFPQRVREEEGIRGGGCVCVGWLVCVCVGGGGVFKYPFTLVVSVKLEFGEDLTNFILWFHGNRVLCETFFTFTTPFLKRSTI